MQSERQAGLEVYLQALLTIPAVLDSHELTEFLTPDVSP